MEILQTTYHRFPSQSDLGEGRTAPDAFVTAVLVRRHPQDVIAAAYAGVGTPEWVADHGRKLTLRQAELWFDTLAEVLRLSRAAYRE